MICLLYLILLRSITISCDQVTARMRSHLLLHRTRLSRTCSVSTRALLSYSGPARYPRNDTRPTPARVSRVARRASTSSPNSIEANSSPSTDKPKPPSNESTTPNGKSVSSDATTPALQVSNEQDFFWSYQSLSESEPFTLPPPEVFEEVLNNVHISLHPQTQHKAAFSTPSGPPVEPTVALYCPIEGGNYVVDDTVRELARRTGSDVVVLDSVHMAAGEWGHFGQGESRLPFQKTNVPALIKCGLPLAASVIEHPQNPLHFSPQATTSAVAHDDDDGDGPGPFFSPQMTLQLVVPPQQAARMSGNAPSKTGMVKAKNFFDMCINVQAPNNTGTNGTQRPRIVYIRDFLTLSSSWASLHPALLSAVRHRRQGALSRTMSPVDNPTVIVFGITPTIFPSSTPSSPPGPQGMMNMLTSRSGQATPGVATSRAGKSDWGEEDHAEKAREWRLRERLRKWERGDHALQSELPKFPTGPVEDDSGSPGQPNNVMVVGGPGGGNTFSSVISPLLGLRPSTHAASSNAPASSGFLRTSILVPATRSLSREKASRIDRRREINELTMRMAVGSVGGLLETPSAASVFSASSGSVPPTGSGDSANAAKMWDDWGNKIEVWTTVKLIGDQAVGGVISSSLPESVRSPLSSVPISWVDVCSAWADQRASQDLRKAWIQQSSNRPAGDDQQDRYQDNERDRQVDDIVETVKHDPYLEAHEQRLLGCIVDSGELATSKPSHYSCSVLRMTYSLNAHLICAGPSSRTYD